MFRAAQLLGTIVTMVIVAYALLPAIDYLQYTFVEAPRIEALEACADPAINKMTYAVVSCMKRRLRE